MSFRAAEKEVTKKEVEENMSSSGEMQKRTHNLVCCSKKNYSYLKSEQPERVTLMTSPFK